MWAGSVAGSVQTRGPDVTEGSGQVQVVRQPAAAQRQRLRRVGDPVVGGGRRRPGARDHRVWRLG